MKAASQVAAIGNTFSSTSNGAVSYAGKFSPDIGVANSIGGLMTLMRTQSIFSNLISYDQQHLIYLNNLEKTAISFYADNCGGTLKC